MGPHLAEQAKLRHDQYITRELASLRESLRVTQERLDEVSRRLEVAERLAAIGASGGRTS